MVNPALPLASCLDIFGQDWDYTPPGAGEPAATVTAIFDSHHEFVDAGGQVPQSTTAPALTVALAATDVGSQVKPFPDGLAPERGGVFTRAGESWEVQDVLQGDDGGAVLPLHQVN